MNKNIFISTVIFIALIFSFACTRSDDTTPEMAQRMLKVRGFKFTETELFRAIKLDDAVVVKGFMQGGMNPNAVNEKGETALTFAIQNSDDKLIKELIEKADINKRDKLGNAPLHLALKEEKNEVFKLLLEKGADVNVSGRRNEKIKDQTVFHLAIAKENAELAKDLLKRGADPGKANNLGQLPLIEAVLASKLDIELIEMMIEKGADVNKKEPESQAHSLIFLTNNKQASSEARRDVGKLLLAKGADKSIKDKDGKTALDWAKQLKNEELVELLK